MGQRRSRWHWLGFVPNLSLSRQFQYTHIVIFSRRLNACWRLFAISRPSRPARGVAVAVAVVVLARGHFPKSRPDVTAPSHPFSLLGIDCNVSLTSLDRHSDNIEYWPRALPSGPSLPSPARNATMSGKLAHSSSGGSCVFRCMPMQCSNKILKSDFLRPFFAIIGNRRYGRARQIITFPLGSPHLYGSEQGKAPPDKTPILQ